MLTRKAGNQKRKSPGMAGGNGTHGSSRSARKSFSRKGASPGGGRGGKQPASMTAKAVVSKQRRVTPPPGDDGDEAYRRLRDLLRLPKTPVSLEVLRIWYKPEDAKLLAAGFTMPIVESFSVEEYANRTGIPAERVQETFDRLSHRGVLFHFTAKEDTRRRYCMPPLFPGLVEYFLINKNVSIDERTAFARKFEKMAEDEGLFIAFASDYAVFRVVPAENTLDRAAKVIEVKEAVEPDRSRVLPFEEVANLIRSARTVAILPCTCRTLAQMMKTHPDCKAPVDVCMAFNAPADFCVSEGIGRYVTREECLEILRQTEKQGLIHLTANSQRGQQFICNCCDCCCGVLSNAFKYRLYDRFVQRSNYVPVIDPERCTRCKRCIRVCRVHALFHRAGKQEDQSDARIRLREEVCIGCGVCAANCAQEAIRMVKVRQDTPELNFPAAVVKMLEKRVYR